MSRKNKHNWASGTAKPEDIWDRQKERDKADEKYSERLADGFGLMSGGSDETEADIDHGDD